MGARRRAWRLLAAVTAATAAITGGTAPADAATATTATAALPAGPAQAGGPAMTLTPSTGLTDGTEVTVTVTGLPADSFVQSAQCVAGTTDIYNQCDIRDLAYDAADAQGTATFTLRVDAVLPVGWNGGGADDVDCRVADACVVAVSTDSETILVSAPLAFDADAPLAPPPTMSVSPAEGLADLQAVTITGSGFVWSDHVSGALCAAAGSTQDACDWETQFDTQAVDGAVSVETPGSAVISTFEGTVDCRVPGACVYALSQGNLLSPSKTATAAVTFDPATEVVPPTITVEPADGLADGDTVTVSGSGFRPNGWVEGYLCAGEVTPANCTWIQAYDDVDDAGGVTLTARVFAAFDRPTGGRVDCRDAGADCSIVLSSGGVSSPRAGRAALAFDPEAPLLPPPTVEVDPTGDLPDDATLTVTGSGFTPGGYTAVEQCVVGTDYLCDQYSGAYADVDSSGGFTVDMPVASVITPWDVDMMDIPTPPNARGTSVFWTWIRRPGLLTRLMWRMTRSPFGPYFRSMNSCF